MSGNRYTKLLSNTAVFAFGTFLSKALVYLMMPFYTYILTKPESSASDLIQQAGNFIMPIAALGVCEALLRYTIDAGERRKEIFSSSMAILLGGSILLLVLSPLLLIPDWFDGYNLLIVAFVLCANIQMAVSYYVRSMGYTKLYAAQGIINTILTAGFNVLFLAVFRWGVSGFILAISVANLLTTVFLAVAVKIWRDFSFSYVKKSTIIELLKYGLPLVPTTLLWSLTNITDKVIVLDFCGEDVNGLFVYAYKIPTLLTLITTVFIEAWQLSAVNDSKEGNDRGKFFEDVFKSYSSLIFVTASGLILFIRFLSDLLLSEAYEPAWVWMPELIVATVFSAFATFMSTVYMVNKKSLPAFLTALTGAAVNIGLSYVLAAVGLGAHGVCLATIVSYVVLFAIRYYTSHKYVDFKINIFRMVVNTLLVSAQAAASVFEFPGGSIGPIEWRIILQAALFAVLFVFNLKPIWLTVEKLFGRFLRK